MAAAYTFPEWINRLTIEPAVKLLVQYFIGNTPPSSGGAGSITVTSPPVTENPVSLGASASQVIPVGAKSWAAVLLTGAGTINGVALPLNVPVSGGTLAATVTIATAGGSSAFVLYET